MGIDTARAVLRHFLTSSDKNVLALTGAWGTGKTHAWRNALLDCKDEIQFKNYAYVSLFGISSMRELRLAIFSKSVPVSTLGKPLDFNTINKQWTDLSSAALKRAVGVLSGAIKGVSYGVSLNIEALLPNLVSDTLVCLDDLERQTLKAEEVLGLITELRDERRCKVALILNVEKLAQDEERAKAFQAYREKAIDYELRYAPTPAEAFDLVFDQSYPQRSLLLKHVLDLEITNVRILRRIRQIVDQIFPVTAPLHQAVIEVSIPSVVLLSWCAFAPSPSKPRIEDIEAWNSHLVFGREGELDPTTEAWVKRFRAFGFMHVDELDVAIARVVEYGYVDGTGFREAAQQADSSLRQQDRANAFSAVWKRFHDSFNNDARAFPSEMFSAAADGIDHLSANNLNGTVRVLRELGRHDLSDDLISKFVAAHGATPGTFDLSRQPFAGDVDDEALRKAFAAAHAQHVPLPSLEEALRYIAATSSYGPEHLDAMRKASQEDYIAVFVKEHADPPLHKLVKAALRWPDGENSDITAKAVDALRDIAKRNELNAAQVRRYGVSLAGGGSEANPTDSP